MTVVFDDEELCVALKAEAARTGRHAKDIIAEALRRALEDPRCDLTDAMKAAEDSMRAVVREKLRLFGAAGRA